ncbi:hypothetical protein Tco_0775387 [Tanacetum coccineum]
MGATTTTGATTANSFLLIIPYGLSTIRGSSKSSINLCPKSSFTAKIGPINFQQVDHMTLFQWIFPLIQSKKENFVCKSSGGAWAAKELNDDLEGFGDFCSFRILGLKIKSSIQALKAAHIWDFSVLSSNGSRL